ncbi:MAG TPA: hypothetical protein VFM15_08785, partial [Gammaproteobacteria bacterium]|nr:hypothetical protein [Gammaproteobacteria bacterium]
HPNSSRSFPARRWQRGLLAAALLVTLASLGACKLTNGPASENEVDPPEVVVGEHLFKDTRFGHYFAVQSGGDVNATLGAGEGVVETNVTTDPDNPLPGAMRGEAVNCLQCHLVEQQLDTPGGGMRTYADFAPRSPLPARPDDPAFPKTKSRNSEAFVDSVFHGNVDQLLHWDGEFSDTQQLVYATLTSQDFGWLLSEHQQAVHQIAQVIRNDNGAGSLARDYDALPYRTVLSCTDQQIPAGLKLPSQYCIDVAHASDEQLAQAVSKLIAAYVDSLTFFQDDNGEYNGSPYDQFLIDNDLPRAPAAGQTPPQYAAALLAAIRALPNPKFVNCCSQFNGADHFEFHDQRPFRFGPQELHGLILFLTRPDGDVITANEAAQGGIGNCAACHAPPEFSDHRIHNTGVTQFEYDKVHGDGAFMALAIPSLSQREADPDAWLPATAQHPNASEVFRSAPSADDPERTDLGVWNIFANPDYADRETSLRKFLCAIDNHGVFADCAQTDAQLLDRAVAVFTTRTLRDLGDSDPYMHDGQFKTLLDTLKFYQKAGALARDGKLRNADPQMQNIALSDADLADLTTFLASLDEDYSQ